MKSVSVIIPCYNYGHHLHDAVASVLDDQPGVDVKVLEKMLTSAAKHARD